MFFNSVIITDYFSLFIKILEKMYNKMQRAYELLLYNNIVIKSWKW